MAKKSAPVSPVITSRGIDAAWLLKTEPGEYAFADLVRAGAGGAGWDGVANPQARGFLRQMQTGDRAFIYHTGSEKAIVGLARVVHAAQEDPEEPGLNDDGLPKAPVVTLAAVRPAARPVTLAAIKADARFRGFALVTQSRLSVMPVSADLAELIEGLAGLRE